MGLYQLHGDGTIWVYTGPPLSGWQLLDNNPATTAIATNAQGSLYQLHGDGTIWKYTGTPMTGWQMLDNNPRTRSIVTDNSDQLYQLHGDGTIWMYTGTPMTGWQLLDNNPKTQVIVVGTAKLYQLHDNGVIWVYTGTPMTGWQMLDNNPRTCSIITDNFGRLYQLHNDGTIWKFTGTPMTGWQLLDNNPGTRSIVAGFSLFQLHGDGTIWKYTGTPMTGWQLLDNNPATTAIITDDNGLLYQMHGDGTIWVYRGPPMTGWQTLDNNPRTRAIIAAGPTKIWARLSFSMQHQQQTNWCWAANSSSVNAFFNSGTSWTQCKIVNAELGRSDCCNNGSNDDCNKPWYLDKALTRVGNFQSLSAGAGSIDDIVKEIDNGRMLCARIGWSGGGGHFVAVEGYNYDLNMVAIEDPWYGPSDITLDTFKSAYKGSGTWTHRYYVKP